MDLEEKNQFIQRLVDNLDVITEEYKSFHGRTIPIPGYDEQHLPLQDWRAISLWWDQKPSIPYQRKFPKTTNLIREGPTHRASGWLILTPQSRTPSHRHLDWGNKIIFHLPIIIPKGDVGFDVDGKIHRWTVGEPFAFDITKEHFGFNYTDETRVLFVLDFDADEWREVLEPYMTLDLVTN
jgi:aspartyl/asparaginyl beta-hydroxylase (cupin superfamily)